MAKAMPWGERWLTGEEYSHILSNRQQYIMTFGFSSNPPKSHPQIIHFQPVNGLLYFLESNSLGSEFGFPKLARKKNYFWKKMNFHTDLPKRHPLVTYIVACAHPSKDYQWQSSREFRMHVVILKEGGSHTLCHLREMKKEKGGEGEERRKKEKDVVSRLLLDTWL